MKLFFNEWRARSSCANVRGLGLACTIYRFRFRYFCDEICRYKMKYTCYNSRWHVFINLCNQSANSNVRWIEFGLHLHLKLQNYQYQLRVHFQAHTSVLLSTVGGVYCTLWMFLCDLKLYFPQYLPNCLSKPIHHDLIRVQNKWGSTIFGCNWNDSFL